MIRKLLSKFTSLLGYTGLGALFVLWIVAAVVALGVIVLATFVTAVVVAVVKFLFAVLSIFTLAAILR